VNCCCIMRGRAWAFDSAGSGYKVFVYQVCACISYVTCVFGHVCTGLPRPLRFPTGCSVLLLQWLSTACSLGLSATSQQYFFSQNKSATSNQPAVLFSQNKPALAISHQPTEQAATLFCCCAVATSACASSYIIHSRCWI
jgi:hypothetical protein